MGVKVKSTYCKLSKRLIYLAAKSNPDI